MPTSLAVDRRRVFFQNADEVLCLDGPTGVALDPSGNIAAGSYFTDSVKFYDPNGTYLGNLYHSGTEDPRCVAYDRRGNLFVGIRNNGNGRVAVFDPELNFVRYIGVGILVPHPAALAFDRSENLWVTMPGSIRKFSHDGTLLDTITDPELEPHGIALDENEDLYVTNANAYEVFVFDPNGSLVDRMPLDMGPAPDPLLVLYGIAFEVTPPLPDFDGDGDVDLNDYDVFSQCLAASGPGREPPFQECLDVFDLDWDFDVDVADFARFAASFTGAQ